MSILNGPGLAPLLQALEARSRRGAAGGGILFTILAVIGLIVVLAYIF